MQKCLPLNFLLLTKVKQKALRKTYLTFLAMVQETLPIVNSVRNRKALHDQTYYPLKEKYPVASQLIIEAASYVWSHRKNFKKPPRNCIIRFDKRLFSFKETTRKNPIISVRTNHTRTGLPICQDGAYQRFLAHLKDDWCISSLIMKRNQSFFVVLKKEFPAPQMRPNTIGIDVNSSNIALTVLTPQEKVLKQTYWGKLVATNQYQFEQRRSVLQQHRDKGSSKAGLKLKRLSGQQRNYVKTNLWQLANDLVTFARNYQANIAIERLHHLRKRKGQWTKKSRKKTNRIPYSLFRQTLQHVATQEGVFITEINPHYTSQACPRCGHTSKKNWRGYSYFCCKICGSEAHRDRVASMNLAKRANQLFQSRVQSSPFRNVAVNPRVLEDEKGISPVLSQTVSWSSKPLNSFSGN